MLKSGSTRKPGAPHKGADELTRMRLLEAAGPIFAAKGFHWAKIRDICTRAGANVAAVNYHFGDKLGLYTEVLRYSIAAAGIDSNLTLSASGVSPEVRLRRFVRMILDCVFNSSRPGWHMKLVLQEMSHPTPAMDEFVEQFIRPKVRNTLRLDRISYRSKRQSSRHATVRSQHRWPGETLSHCECCYRSGLA